MTEYEVQWWGGQLDGCKKTTAFLPPWWQGPDITNLEKTLWYQLMWPTPSTPLYVWRPQGPPVPERV